MMKTRLSALLVASACFTGPLAAAEISQQTADQLVATFTKYLPKEAVDTGFITVVPASNRYEFSVDLQALIDFYKPKEFTLSGLKPFVHYLTPQDDGLWRVEANQTLDVMGTAGTGDQKADFRYRVDAMTFDGLFDPAISYLSRGDWTSTGALFESKSATETINATFGPITQTFSTAKVSDTHINLDTSGTLTDWKQTMTSTVTGPVTVTAEKMGVTVSMASFGVVPFRDLVIFVLDNLGRETLDAAAADQLKVLLRANLPMTDKLVEDIVINKLTVEADGKTGSVDEFGYSFAFGGFKRDSDIAFGMRIKKPVMPGGVLPAGTDQALPDDASFGVKITNLNLGDAATYFLDNADLTADEPLTPAESEQIGKIILPDGKLYLEFSNSYMRSAHYDIEVTGTMAGEMDNSNKFVADMTITARDLDGTIKFLQDNAGAIPEFGQAAFGAQMMKGFAKQEADGRFTWNIVMGEDGKLRINGQEFPAQ